MKNRDDVYKDNTEPPVLVEKKKWQKPNVECLKLQDTKSGSVINAAETGFFAFLLYS